DLPRLPPRPRRPQPPLPLSLLAVRLRRVEVIAGTESGDQGPSGFTVCDECEDGWVYPAPHGVDATDCPAFYDICRCEETPCPSCRGSGLVGGDGRSTGPRRAPEGPRGQYTSEA